MKRTRRFLGLFLSLLLLFSACDSSQPTGDSEAGTTVLPEDITEDLTAFRKYESLYAAMFFSDRNAADTAALSASFDKCFASEKYSQMRAEKQFQIPASDFSAARAVFDAALRGGCGIVFASDDSLFDLVQELALEYPDVWFFCRDGEAAEAENLYSYHALLYQGFYLAGIAASSVSRTGRVALLTEPGTDAADAVLWANAFALGAQAVNDSVSVALRQIEADSDAVSALQELANARYDVFAGNFASAAVYEAAAQRGVQMIGYQGQVSEAQGVIADVYFDFSSYFDSVLEAAAEQSAPISRFEGGLTSGVVGLRLLTDNNEVQALIDAAAGQITQNDFEIFSGYQLYFESAEDGSVHASAEPAAVLSADGEVILPEGVRSRLSASEPAPFSDTLVQGLTER